MRSFQAIVSVAWVLRVQSLLALAYVCAMRTTDKQKAIAPISNKFSVFMLTPLGGTALVDNIKSSAWYVRIQL